MNNQGASNTGDLVNRSGSIIAGSVAQQVAAAVAQRRYIIIQNVSAGDLWIDFGVAAVEDQPSIRLSAGATFVMEGSYICGQSISIIGAAPGQKFTAKEG
jgi:hypothetical protein